MRSERVVTNQTCNQNCTYCDRRAATEDAAFARGPAVVARIDAALETQAMELVLTGGEPTLRADLPQLVRRAAARGGKTVLETNAALVTPELAASLREAGLTLARVNLSGADARLDGVTRDEGGFDATLRGARALKNAGVRLELCAAVVRSTLPLLDGLPPLAAAEGFAAIVLAVPVTSPDPSELLPLHEAAQAIERVERAARPLAVSTRLSADAPLPPCVFPKLPRSAHLFSLTRGGAERPGFHRLETCSACAVADRCPGFPSAALERFGPPTSTPVTDPRVRRSLSLISTVEEQVERELVEPSASPDGEEVIVRVNFHCNQACEFCFVSTHLPAASDARIEQAIRDAAARGAKIVISGGEPTLNPRAAEWVRLARTLSGKPVMLQTNAIRLDDAALAGALVEAGASEAFVSLHGDTAELSDEITKAPGTFERTLRGLDNLARTPATVIINFVICAANHARLVPFVDFVAGRWPRALLNLSFIAPMTDVVPHEARLIPRYDEVRPHLEAALERAALRSLSVVGFQSMCGLPLCQVPERARAQLKLEPVDPALARGEFVKAEACASCALSDRCYGLRRRYAELHGTAELRAVV